MKRNFVLWLFIGLFILTVPAVAAQTREQKDERMAWWRQAKFGMFIHWGLYALPAGEWKGQQLPWIGEWIMNRARIPVKEYERLARQFNPVRFNADEWVAVAKNAGMKYIVITSKHHDGFAMYGSRASKYNIVDATPFHRDPMKELAEACRKQGLRLCFYYSHAQDWHHPDAAGNDWDFPDETGKNFARYFEEKAKPQVRELMAQYGPIGLLWFDTPRVITKAQSEELAALVHELQPPCIVSGRVGHGAGDYQSMGDNSIPGGVLPGDWETPATLNDTWGYKKNDHNWKPVETLIQQLVDIVSKGGNYLLNVGPTAEGVIPQPSVERLARVGEWLKVSGEAIYGVGPSPYPSDFEWGSITSKPGRLYLHVVRWPKDEFALYGVKNKVTKAYLLADPKRRPLKVSQKHDPQLDHDALRIRIPAAAPDQPVSVIALEIDGQPSVDTRLMQQPDGRVMLPAFLAEVHKDPARPSLSLNARGVAERWTNPNEWLSWEFKVVQPGTFEVALLTSEQRAREKVNWEGGHVMKVTVAGQELKGRLEDQGRSVNPRNPLWRDVLSKMGRVTFSKPGSYRLTVQPESLEGQPRLGVTLRVVKLLPVRESPVSTPTG